MVFSLAALFLQNIIVIPIILMLSVSSLKMYRILIKEHKNVNIKTELARHTILSVTLMIPLILAAFIETYISTTLICLYK